MKKIDHNIGFWKKNANFFTENWRKSQKIVIITSTPGKIWQPWTGVLWRSLGTQRWEAEGGVEPEFTATLRRDAVSFDQDCPGVNRLELIEIWDSGEKFDRTLAHDREPILHDFWI
jgi:hypothetical protein